MAAPLPAVYTFSYKRGKKKEMRLMKKSGRIACLSLAVTLVSGLWGLVYLISLGVREITSSGTGVMDDMAWVFYLVVAVMFVSTVVMIAAFSGKK